MRVVVVGSGLLGLSTAYFLMRDKAEVIVVDQASGPAQGTSFANGGLLTSSMAEPWNTPGVLRQIIQFIGRTNAPLQLQAQALPSLLMWGVKFFRESNPQRYDCNTLKNVRLALYSQRALKEIQQEAEIPCDYTQTGSLKLFRHIDALEGGYRRAQWLQRHGIPSQPLGAQEIVDLEPTLVDIRSQIAGGIYFPSDSVGDAQRYCEGLAVTLQSQGAEMRFRTSVLGWKRRGMRIEAAVTDNGLLAADRFVLAAANASRKLTRPLGFDVPIRPVKGYSITVPRECLPKMPSVPVIDDELHAVFVPIGQNLRVAGTAEFAGLDHRIPIARIENLCRLLRETYPCANVGADRSTLRPWTGLRPVSADGVPILGATPIENLYINTGHGHLGWTLAAGSGKAVAELIGGRISTIEMADYTLVRF